MGWLHRYTWLLYEQAETIALKDVYSFSSATSTYPQDPTTSRSGFNVTAFAEKHKLGEPVAINWMLLAPGSIGPNMYSHVNLTGYITEACQNTQAFHTACTDANFAWHSSGLSQWTNGPNCTAQRCCVNSS